MADPKEPTDEDIKASYGFVALLGNAVPEIQSLLNEAIKNKWTPDRFVMSVANTNWWKSTPAAMRDWIIRSATDPAQAFTEKATGADSIRNLAAQMGVPMPSEERAAEIWLWTKVAGYDENGTRAYLSRVAFDEGGWQEEGGGGGAFGRMVNDMFRLSAEYGYTTTDLSGEILEKAEWIMRTGGNVDISGWQSKMIEYAQSKFAPYAEDIRGGKTVAEIARPIVDRVSNLLEVNPDALNFDDPLLKKALTEWGAENRAYSLNEIENFARQDARWKTTDNAMESSVKLLNEIGETFGVLGGGR